MEQKMIEDLYQEHALHPRPYWMTMSKCSECFKKHQEIKLRLRSERNYKGESDIVVPDYEISYRR